MTRGTEALALAAASLVACAPELDDRSFLVAGPRLLAIASTPAEAAPETPVTLRALYVDPDGDRGADLSWSFCVARQALTDQGTVSPECVSPGGAGLVPFGSGPSAGGPLPAEGCRLFGPDAPDAMMGQPAGRPVDPDPTGGFYQPAVLRIHDDGDAYAVGTTRLACGLVGATPAIAADFTQRYRANTAPAIHALALRRADGTTAAIAPEAPGAAPGATVKAGEKVTLTASWAACPTAPACGDGICGADETLMDCPADCTVPAGCTGSEPYVVFDPEARALVTHRETIRVAWFATGGSLATDTGGRDESEADTSTTEDDWTAPTSAGVVRLWIVVRDDRGGVGWESYRVLVD